MMRKNKLLAVHPGRFINDAIEEMGLSQVFVAKKLKCSESQLSRVINSKCSITFEMCITLAEFFGGSVEMWVRLQVDYNRKQKESQNEN